MHSITKRFPLIILCLFISTLGHGQSNEISIKFIGNCGLHLTDGKADLFIDFPYKSGAYGYMKYDASELDSIGDDALFLFTHRHADHYSRKILKKYRKKGDQNIFGSWNTKDFDQLGNSIDEFEIEVFKTKHNFSLKHCSYLITWHGKKLYFSGDTETADTIAKVKGINWAFVPYWILLDSEENQIKLDVEMYALYHLYPNHKITVEPDGIIKLLDRPGEVISIAY